VLCEHRGCPVSRAIDRGVRVTTSRLRLYSAGRSEIDDDATEEAVGTATVLPKRHVHTPDQISVARDTLEQPIFRVGSKLVRDDHVRACQHDPHTDRSGKLRATSGQLVSSYSFILRQRVTVLMWSASAAFFLLPL